MHGVGAWGAGGVGVTMHGIGFDPFEMRLRGFLLVAVCACD